MVGKAARGRKVSEVTGIYRARLTSKGQITIPAAVREQLGLRTGDEVMFEPKTRRFSAAPRPKLSDLYGILQPAVPTPSWSRERERQAVADAAGDHDAEKTARIQKRLAE